MKKNNFFKIITFTGLVLVSSCGDEQQYFPALSPADQSGAKVKFIHAASDTAGVNLYFAGTKISGNAQSIITTTGAVNIGTLVYQAAFPATDYAGVSTLSGDFSVVVPEVFAANDTFPSKTMATLGATISPQEYYTVAFVGAFPSYEAVIYPDDLSATPINGKAYLRFANFIDNSTDKILLRGTPPVHPEINPAPVPVVLAPEMSFKEMSGFIQLPQTGTYTAVQIVNATTGAVIATLTSASSSFAPNKVYTLYACGRIGVTPAVSRMINR
jgi:hypothetical protein